MKIENNDVILEFGFYFVYPVFYKLNLSIFYKKGNIKTRENELF